jgi:hypothetical protein
VEFNLNAFPNNAVNVFDFCGNDRGTEELHVLSLADTVFSYQLGKTGSQS